MLLTGGKISVHNLKGMLSKSYDKKNSDHDNFKIDNELSGRRVKVYHNNDTNKTVVSHKGTQSLNDWVVNAKLLLGYKNVKRFKHAKNIQNQAEAKYGTDNLTTIGHSLAGKIAEVVGQNGREIITLNKPTTPLDLYNNKKIGNNQIDIRTKNDPVSILRKYQNGNNEFIIPSTTNNLLKEHKTDALNRLDQDMMIGQGIKKKHINIYYKNKTINNIVALVNPTFVNTISTAYCEMEGIFIVLLLK